MGDIVSYVVDKAEIRQDKMQMTVTNRRPKYLHQSLEMGKREIEKQLFRIFQKYA